MPSPNHPIPTVAEAVEAFIARRLERDDWAPQTLRRTGGDLRQFATLWPDDTTIIELDSDCLRMYDALSGMAPASRRSRYHAVTGFLHWCVARGWLSRHPAERLCMDDLPWRGRRARAQLGRGKPQLQGGAEVKAYLRAARTWPKAERRAAAMLPLLTGLRSGELRHLRVSDVDFVLGRIWVRRADSSCPHPDGWDVKSAAAVRSVSLPACLVVDLQALVERRHADAYVFGPGNRAYQDVWLWTIVTETCSKAGVRRVNPHGLRGTWNTLRKLAGDSADARARDAGHADRGVTLRRHYDGAADHQLDLQRLQAGLFD